MAPLQTWQEKAPFQNLQSWHGGHQSESQQRCQRWHWRTTLSHTLHRAGLFGRVESEKKKRHLEFAKQHMADSSDMKECSLVRRKCYVLSMGNSRCGANPSLPIAPRTPFTLRSMVVAASYCEDAFYPQGLEKWPGLKNKMDGTNYQAILEEHLFQSARDLRLGWNILFHQDNDPKHTANATLRWFQCLGMA